MSAALPVQAQLTASVSGPKRPFVFSAIWLGVWGAMAVWVAYALATAWPYVGLMPQWLLLIALPGMVFRVFDLVSMRALGHRVKGWRRILARAVALFVGAFATAASWVGLDAISMARFESAMVPLVARVQTHPEALCRPDASSVIGTNLATYLDAANAPRASAELHYDKQRFVLALPGRSMDIDGSTMFYDSRGHQWRKVHNDALNHTGELVALTAGLAACRFSLR